MEQGPDRAEISQRARNDPATLLNDRLRDDPTRDPTTGFEEWETLRNEWGSPTTGTISRRTGRYLVREKLEETLDPNGYNERRNVPTRRRPAPQYRPTPYCDALEEWPDVTGNTDHQPPEQCHLPPPIHPPLQEDVWGFPSPRSRNGPAPGERDCPSEQSEENEEPDPWHKTGPYPPAPEWKPAKQVNFAEEVEEAERLPSPPPAPFTVEPSDAEWCLRQAATFVADNGPELPRYQAIKAEEVFEDASPENEQPSEDQAKPPTPLSPRLLPIRLPGEDNEGTSPPRPDRVSRQPLDPRTERKERRQERRFEAQMLDLVFTPSMDETSQDDLPAPPKQDQEGTAKQIVAKAGTLNHRAQQESTTLGNSNDLPAPPCPEPRTSLRIETSSPPEAAEKRDLNKASRNEERASPKGKARSERSPTRSSSPTPSKGKGKTLPSQERHRHQRSPEDQGTAKTQIASRRRDDRSVSSLTRGIQTISLVPEAERRRQRRLPEDERDTLLIEMTRRQAQLVLGQTNQRTDRYSHSPSGRRESTPLPPSQRERRLLTDRSRSPSTTSSSPPPSRNQSASEATSSEDASPPRQSNRESRAQRQRNRSPIWRRDRRGHSYVRCYRPDDTEDEEERRRERRAQRRVARRRADARSPSLTYESITPRHHRDTTPRPRHHHR